MYTSFGQTIKAYRKQAKLSQKDLADLAGVGKTTVFDLEKGKLTLQLQSILKICEVLNIEVLLKGPFDLKDDA